MTYLHCPRCHRAAWVDASAQHVTDCRHCGARLGGLAGHDAALLATAVRERFARDARTDAARARFVRGAR